jgi:Cupredoxin-like domain
MPGTRPGMTGQNVEPHFSDGLSSRALEPLQGVRVFLPLFGVAIERVWDGASSAITESANMFFPPTFSKAAAAAVVLFAPIAAVGHAHAQAAIEIALSYKDKTFDPAEIGAPANTPIMIKFRNLDRDAMEFESDTLHIEKVVAAGKEATFKIRAQKPGRYEFFDEYNEKTARGVLVVK